MTTKEIMHELYTNAEIVWGEYHNGICPRSVSVMYEGTEYRIFAEDKPVLDEVQRRLEMSEWHTETPTEAGLYLTAVRFDGYYAYEPVHWDGKWGFRHLNKPIVAWQRIEPFKEASE